MYRQHVCLLWHHDLPEDGVQHHGCNEVAEEQQNREEDAQAHLPGGPHGSIPQPCNGIEEPGEYVPYRYAPERHLVTSLASLEKVRDK